MHFQCEIRTVFAVLCLFGVELSAALPYSESARESSNPTSLASILTSKINDWGLGTVVSFPGQDIFANATERWTTYRQPGYVASISPKTEADVVEAIKFSISNRLPILATGGRHGYNTDLGNLRDGIAIDLSGMNQVLVDNRAGTLTVGPGARFRDIVGPVSNAGFEIQTGTSTCPAMIGVTIGGGVGRLGGIYGLVIDALISARLVTADGRIVEVTADSNADLFWGIRGAGANFGIITQATYKLQPNPTHASYTSVDVVFPADKNASYFNMLQSLLTHQPPELSVTSSISYNTTINQPQITGSWVYRGPREVALRVMAPMLALHPSVISISDVSWEDVSAVSFFGSDASICIPGRNVDVYSANLRTLSTTTAQSTFSKMAAFYETNPEARGSAILLESFPNQAAMAVADSTTAFPWRDTSTYVLMLFTWDQTSTTARTTESAANSLGLELRSNFAATSGYASGLAIYANYAHGDETLEQVFTKDNLPRLAGLKAVWDPANIFAYNNPLPTHYS